MFQNHTCSEAGKQALQCDGFTWFCDGFFVMIYWQGINIGDWQFLRNFANIIINKYMDTSIKKTNSPNITLTNKLSCMVLKFELNCPVINILRGFLNN